MPDVHPDAPNPAREAVAEACYLAMSHDGGPILMRWVDQELEVQERWRGMADDALRALMATIPVVMGGGAEALLDRAEALRAERDSAVAELAKYRANPLWNVRAVDDDRPLVWDDDDGEAVGLSHTAIAKIVAR